MPTVAMVYRGPLVPTPPPSSIAKSECREEHMVPVSVDAWVTRRKLLELNLQCQLAHGGVRRQREKVRFSPEQRALCLIMALGQDLECKPVRAERVHLKAVP